MLNVHIYPSPFTNESRILREARSLLRLGIFSAIDLVGTRGSGLAPVETVQECLQIHRLGRETNAGAGLVRKTMRAVRWSSRVLREYRRRPVACINCHSVSVLPVSVLLKKATGARLVYDAHELETETNGLSGIRKTLTKVVERRLIRHADHAIFVGPEIERWYRREYGIETTSVVYNCPAYGRAERSDRFRTLFGIRPEIPVFLYQGVLGPGRGIERLIEAFEGLVPEASLVLMGYGPLRDYVEGRAAVVQNVFFHPAVSPAELPAFTAAADFGLSMIEPTSLSYELCMPNKLFEYLMADVPVVVSPTREQRQLVTEHGVGVVADDLSVDGVRAAVREILTRDRSTLLRSVAAAKERFCWERQEPVLENVYRGLGFARGSNDDV